MRLFWRLTRLLLVLVAILVVAIVGGLAWLLLSYPKTAPPTALKVAGTPEQIARGAYLSRHVAGCTDCHGERDWTKYSAPQMRDREGHGGMIFKLDVGDIHAPNITPAAIGSWTDGEVLRAMTEGVSRDGRPLFPMMPYQAYRTMAREDVEALIAFVRTFKPAARDIPKSELHFPMNLIVRTIPQPAVLPDHRPDPANRVAYGEYLTTIASCSACHTRMVRGQPVPGMRFAGGEKFEPASGGVQYSANITPDAETGIGNWTEAQFIGRFKAIADAPEADLALNGRRNTEMPWRDYGGMETGDLSAIYAYLRTVPAVRNAVPR
jgi:mono/diheme cytochrome c family protein